MTWMDERLVVEMQDNRGGSHSTATFNGPDYANMAAQAGDPLPALRNLDKFRNSVRSSLLQPLMPQQSSSATEGKSYIPPMVSTYMYIHLICACISVVLTR